MSLHTPFHHPPHPSHNCTHHPGLTQTRMMCSVHTHPAAERTHSLPIDRLCPPPWPDLKPPSTSHYPTCLLLPITCAIPPLHPSPTRTTFPFKNQPRSCNHIKMCTTSHIL